MVSQKVSLQQFVAAKLWLQWFLVSMKLEHSWRMLGWSVWQSHLMTIIIATGIKVIDTEYNNLSSNKKIQYPETGEHWQFDMKKVASLIVKDVCHCVSRLCMKVPQRELQTTNLRLPFMSSKSTPSAQGNKTPRLCETCNPPRRVFMKFA